MCCFLLVHTVALATYLAVRAGPPRALNGKCFPLLTTGDAALLLLMLVLVAFTECLLEFRLGSAFLGRCGMSPHSSHQRECPPFSDEKMESQRHGGGVAQTHTAGAQ